MLVDAWCYGIRDREYGLRRDRGSSIGVQGLGICALRK